MIDFESLKGNHRCGWKSIPNREQGKPTDRREYDCAELRELERMLRIWKVEPSTRPPRREDGRRRSSKRADGQGRHKEGGDDLREPEQAENSGEGNLIGGGGEGEGEGEFGANLGGGEREFTIDGQDREISDLGADEGDNDPANTWPQENEDNDVKVVPEPAAPVSEKAERKKKKSAR